MMSDIQQMPAVSDYFELYKIGDGVYAAIDNGNGAAVGNAGIVDMGDAALIFDTFITPKAARDLQAAAENLTGHPVKWVVNSHYHNDHIRGNQIFDEDTVIVSTEETCRLIQTAGVDELDYDRATAHQHAQQFQAQFDNATDDAQRTALRFTVRYYQEIAESLPEIVLRVPDLTFKQVTTIHGSKRNVDVQSFGRGHTGSDAILLVPDAQVAFLADVLFVDFHPFLADGDARALLAYLDAVDQLHIPVLVPGHGPVGTPDDLHRMKDYVQTVLHLAESLVKAGKSADDAAAQPIPAAFKDWHFAQFFAHNMRFVHRYCSSDAD